MPMTDWLQFDKGTKSLLLVGATLESAMPLSFLSDVPQIAVDGGISFARNPVLWAGDGDSGSIPSDVQVFLKHNQDETDLRFCLTSIRLWQWTELHLIGFLGERRDHELVNFGEIYAEM